jgi:hypothetical protein
MRSQKVSQVTCRFSIASVIALIMLVYCYFLFSIASPTPPTISPNNQDETSNNVAKIVLSNRALFADPDDFRDLDSIHEYYQNALRPLNDMVTEWPPILPDSKPADWKDLVPHFDWTDLKSREAAQRVREAELPFILRNVPSVVAASQKWDPVYLSNRFTRGRVERSTSNSFMYWRNKNGVKGPTEMTEMSWSAFLDEAKALDASDNGKPGGTHFYWHTSARGKDKWISDELDLFQKDNSFFIVDPVEYDTPIACRVGTKGLCNENHYDTHRTFTAQIVGSKRWIFMPPSECSKLYLFPNKHMSARHSPVDINSGRINGTAFPLAMSAVAIETVIHAGEVGYLPSNWFHHIISQEFNVQCIARSGHSLEGDDYIEKCGFAGGRRSMKTSGRSQQDIPPKKRRATTTTSS